MDLLVPVPKSRNKALFSTIVGFRNSSVLFGLPATAALSI
jgi:hypothetical protein